jgi:hypothetical protein
LTAWIIHIPPTIQIELSGNDGSQEVLFLIDSIDQTTGNTQIVN